MGLVSHLYFLKVCMLVCAQLLSCVQPFYSSMDCTPPGSSVHSISQARIKKPQKEELNQSGPPILKISVIHHLNVLSLSCVSSFCDPTDYSPPSSSVQWIFQARILEWVAISTSKGSSWPRDWTHTSWESCVARGIFFFTAVSCEKPP